MSPSSFPLLGARAVAVSLFTIRGGANLEPTALVGIAGTTAAITKSVLGMGVLTLANAISRGTGVGPATMAMAATTAVGAYSFSLVGEVCAASNLGAACTFQALWAATIGPSSLWLLQAAVVSLCFSYCIIYLICLGELLPALFGLARAPACLRSRRAGVLLGAAAVLPLCLPAQVHAHLRGLILGPTPAHAEWHYYWMTRQSRGGAR